jgi:hypothetical protein
VKGAPLVWSVVVEKRCEDDTYYRFAVWDIELGAEFLRKSKIQKKVVYTSMALMKEWFLKRLVSINIIGKRMCHD